MSKSRDALVAVTIAAVVFGSWAFENRPRTSHTAALRELLASPVCLRADGSPQPGGPTVARAWRTTIRLPIERAKPNFVGDSTIELTFRTDSAMGHLTFVRGEPHIWRPNDDIATIAWLARVCGAGT